MIGRSDGTIECDFCQTHFTVQVQPEFNSMPQTIDGQPNQMPGMPGGGPPDLGDAGDPDADAPAMGDADQPAPDDQPPEESDDGTVEDDTDGAGFGGQGQKPPWLKGSSRARVPQFFVTAAGIALDEEGYQRHLALMLTEDRAATLTEVRAGQ